MNHIGITVPDLEAALRFYTAALGLRLLEGPIDADLTTEGHERRRDVFGARWVGMRLAHLTMDDGVGIELFEFVSPTIEIPDDSFTYWRVGVFHFALTVDDLPGVIRAITDHGGKQRSAMHTVRPGCDVCYCEDPWGNSLELSSRPYVETHPPVAAIERADNA